MRALTGVLVGMVSLGVTLGAWAQERPALRVREDDGTPTLVPVYEVIVPNGMLSRRGPVGAVVALTPTGSITMADDQWIGLGASAGRIEFDDQVTDEVNILNARLGISNSAPTKLLDILTNTTGEGVIIRDGQPTERQGGFFMGGGSDFAMGALSNHVLNIAQNNIPMIRINTSTNNYCQSIGNNVGLQSSSQVLIKSNAETVNVLEGKISTNTTSFIIDENGNLGVGVSNPAQLLDVRGGGINTAAFGRFGNSDSTQFITIGSGRSGDTVDRIFFGSSATRLEIGPTASDGTPPTTGIFILASNGFVGVNTTSPTNILSLGGNSARTFWMERHTTADTAGNSLTVQSGGATSGATNKVPGSLVLATGLGTGNAAAGQIELQGSTISATAGTSDQSLVDRMVIGATKALTDGLATNLVNATIASGSVIGGTLRYTVEVTNGTDFQVETGEAFYSSYNKAGTVSGTITEANSQQNLSAGTLATTWAISNASPAVISLNADTSLTPSTGYPRVTYILENNTQQAVAIQ